MTDSPEKAGAAPAGPGARRAPSLRRRLAVLAAGAVVLVLALEWGLKAFNVERLSHVNPDLYEADAELRFRQKANVRVYSHGCWWETNEHGIRGDSWTDAHATGRDCVVFFGHSIAGGFGVKAEEAFPGLFTELNTLGLVGINMGTCGYKYWQELPFAERFLDDVRPVASVVMFTSNDFEEPMDPFTPSVDGIEESRGQIPFPGKPWLRRNSALYNYARKRWSRLLVALGLRTVPPSLDYAMLEGESEESRAAFDDYEEYLLRYAEASGAPLILTAFPMGQCEYSYGRIRDLAERLGAPYVDLSDLWTSELDYMRRGSLGWGTHPSAATHRVLAERFTAAVETLLRPARAN